MYGITASEINVYMNKVCNICNKYNTALIQGKWERSGSVVE